MFPICFKKAFAIFFESCEDLIFNTMKNNKKKEIKAISIPFKLTWPKKGESIKPTLNTTQVTLSGIFLTCIVLSIVSGFIDLTFFSGLSKSHYAFFGFAKGIPAGILFSLMSIGFILGKFFCAMMIGALNELQTRLQNAGFAWYKNIKRAKLKWHIAHKFIITISLITSISLSVVSIGDAIRKNQNVIKRANEDIQKITKYANTTDTSDDVQFQALVTGTAASSTAGTKAAEQAAKIWPIIEDYRIERADFEDTFGNIFGSKNQVEWKGQNIVPNDYWDKQNSLVVNKVKAAGRNLSLNQIRNITSEASLATAIKEEIEKSVANNSLDELTELAGKTKEKAVQEIKNLEGRYFMPGSNVPVVFDPENISGSLTLLSDIKAAYENDTGDIGESSKLFMLIGPQIDNAKKERAENIEEAFNQKVNVSSFGTTEIMMMVLIMIFGIVQEFLIALFTPKATISRPILYKYDAYFGKDFDIDDFLLDVYRDYKKKGVITKERFEVLARECVEEMEDTKDDVIHRYSKKWQAEQKVQQKEDSTNELLKQYQAQIEKLKRENAKLASPETVAESPKIDLSNPIKDLAIEVPLDKPNFPDYSKQKSIFVGDSKKESEENFSEEVDKAVAEIDDLLKEE